MNEPSGEKILATLVKLLAEQENVKIQCEIKKGEKNEKCNFNSNHGSNGNGVLSVC